MENRRTLLQKIFGDDNVLVVKFMVPSDESIDFYRQHYHKIAEDGIILGLRRYEFFGEFLIIQNLFWIYYQQYHTHSLDSTCFLHFIVLATRMNTMSALDIRVAYKFMIFLRTCAYGVFHGLSE